MRGIKFRSFRRLVAGSSVAVVVASGCARSANDQADSTSVSEPRTCVPPSGRTIIEFADGFFGRTSACPVMLRAENEENQLVVRDPGHGEILAVGRLPESCRAPHSCEWQATQSAIGPFFLALRAGDSHEYADRAWLFWVSQGWIRNVEVTLGEQGFVDDSTTGAQIVLDPWICGNTLGLFVDETDRVEPSELSFEANRRQGLYQADGEGWYVLPASDPPAGCRTLASLMLP